MQSAPDENATLHELTRRYSFGKGPAAQRRCRDWIRTQGIGDNEWVQYSSPRDRRLPRKHLDYLDAARSKELVNQHPSLAGLGVAGGDSKSFEEVHALYLVATAGQLLKEADLIPKDETLLAASIDLWLDIAKRSAWHLELELCESDR
jgi:hypothetical protein